MDYKHLALQMLTLKHDLATLNCTIFYVAIQDFPPASDGPT